MNPDIEGKLRSGEHIYGKSKSVPSGSENQNYSEKLASKRFKEIINKVKRYHGVESIKSSYDESEMFSDNARSWTNRNKPYKTLN